MIGPWSPHLRYEAQMVLGSALHRAVPQLRDSILIPNSNVQGSTSEVSVGPSAMHVWQL
jgi:hypothetical protein